MFWMTCTLSRSRPSYYLADKYLVHTASIRATPGKGRHPRLVPGSTYVLVLGLDLEGSISPRLAIVNTSIRSRSGEGPCRYCFVNVTLLRIFFI